MPKSASHELGEFIGWLLEETFEDSLRKIAKEYNYYIDRKHKRPARKNNIEVVWIDKYGNKHKLDFVIEKGGTERKFGIPVAFIEIAWRRYSKHAKNKAQEIQGAVKPLEKTFKRVAPFLGAIIAGDFTKNSIDQLVSQNFNVLFIPIEKIFEAFKVVNIKAYWGEKTPRPEVAAILEQCRQMNEDDKQKIKEKILELTENEKKVFLSSLKNALTRQLSSIRIIPLHGNEYSFVSIENAISFIEKYQNSTKFSIIKYELYVLFNNGDEIKATFHDKESIIEFLQEFSTSYFPDVN
ncbi:MAG: DNA methylase [Candidatus Hermodarchaeota archaeon]